MPNTWIEQAKALREVMRVSARTLPDEEVFAAPVGYFDEWSGESVEYLAGDVRQYESELYRCLTAHTSQESWTPSAAPSLWVRMDDPATEWPQWVQPLGATDAYPLGAKVSHNEKHWISEADNNTWEPGVYGWREQV
jgi:hypothetical protein